MVIPEELERSGDLVRESVERTTIGRVFHKSGYYKRADTFKTWNNTLWSDKIRTK